VYSKDVIVAPATPPGEGGVAIIRLSGPGCLQISLQFFRASASRFTPKSHTFFHGFLYALDGVLLDEVFLVYMAAPRSFTAEDVVEIHCHGGGQTVDLILRSFLSAGCRLANPGEFSFRAFLNGRIDLTQAEATAALIQSRSVASQRLALAQMGGSLSKFFYSSSEKVRDILALFEAWIDFPEEDLPIVDFKAAVDNISNLKSSILSLVDSYNTGRLYTEGATVLLLGRPNVGKSSLLNALLEENRAIVTDIPGTTTDTIEESLLVNGLRLNLIDTAGLTDSDNVIESHGVLRAQQKLETADLVLFLVDGNTGYGAADKMAFSYCENKSERVFFVITKADMPAADLPDHIVSGAVTVSSLTGSGLDVLRNKIYQALVGGNSNADSSILLTNVRHRDAANRAMASMDRFVALSSLSSDLDLLCFELREILFHLGEITGESASPDVLELIFSKFCIGK
jgi:tRNA modification GTPase